MSDFSFTATAECDLCGNYLSSSDEECDHDGKEIDKHVFRRMFEGRESFVGVKCAWELRWEKLEEKVDDWIAYQYLGPKHEVNLYLSAGWEPSEVPKLEMSTDRVK